MIDTGTISRLRAMRLSGMADCLEQLPGLDTRARLAAPDVVKMAVDHEWELRQTNKLARLRRAAGLAQPHADVADIQALPGRRVETEAIARLAVGTYILKRQDVIIQGPTGSGKTYVACALGNKACQQRKRVVYLPAGELFDRLVVADRAGRRRAEVDSLAKADLLILDISRGACYAERRGGRVGGPGVTRGGASAVGSGRSA
jgi:DNA replication protein DnaC